jgi:hypothetical protein
MPDVIVQNTLCGSVEPGKYWTKGSDDVEDDGKTLKQRTMWHAIPSNERKERLTLYTREAAEFYVAACAGYLVGGS